MIVWGFLAEGLVIFFVPAGTLEKVEDVKRRVFAALDQANRTIEASTTSRDSAHDPQKADLIRDALVPIRNRAQMARPG